MLGVVGVRQLCPKLVVAIGEPRHRDSERAHDVPEVVDSDRMDAVT